MKKVALVSGANKGIGKEVARQLLGHGFKVYVGSRDLAKGSKTASEISSDGTAQAIQLDVTDQNSVDAAIATIAKNEKRLDLLVNNAGILTERATGIENTDIDEVEATFKTNFFGPLRLTKAAWGLLKGTDDSRVINVSSSLGSISKMGGAEFSEFRYIAYSCSKAALNMLTVLTAGELSKNGGSVNSICPGYVATDINDNQGYRTVEQGAQIVIKLATDEKSPNGTYVNDEGKIDW